MADEYDYELQEVGASAEGPQQDGGNKKGKKQKKGTIRYNARPIHPNYAYPLDPDDLQQMRRDNWARKVMYESYHNPKAPIEYRPYFIWLITAVDIIMFVVELIVNEGFADLTKNPLWGPDVDTLVDMGAKYGPLMQDGEVWRFITPVFLHVGVWHLAFNCCTQWRVGIAMERRYGFFRIIPVYFLSAFTGNIVSVIFLPKQVQVGASGAIFGLIGIMGVDLIENWNKIASPCCSLISYLFSIAFSLLIGLLPGIDNFAHIGGFFQGIIAGIIFFPRFGKKSVKASGPWRWIVALSFVPLNAIAIVAGLLIFYLGVDAEGWCTFCTWIDCLPVADWCGEGGTEPNDD